MNKKRSIAILLTVVMLLTMFPANVFAGGYDNCLVGYEHSHNENCYKKLETVSEPQCGFAEEHEHGAECCTITDPEHVHGDGEFCECEIPSHSHTAACYQVVTIVEEPQCGLVEHVHGDACSEKVKSEKVKTEKVLLAPLAAGPTAVYSYTVTVELDRVGKIAGANVVLSRSGQTYEQTTGTNGQAVFSSLSLGEYDYTVSFTYNGQNYSKTGDLEVQSNTNRNRKTVKLDRQDIVGGQTGQGGTFDHIDIQAAAQFTYTVDGEPQTVNINFYEQSHTAAPGGVEIYKNSISEANRIPVSGRWQNSTSGNQTKEYRISGTFDKNAEYIVRFTFTVNINGVDTELTYQDTFTFAGATNVCPGTGSMKGLDIELDGKDLGDFFSYGTLRIKKAITGNTPTSNDTFNFTIYGPIGSSSAKTYNRSIQGAGSVALTDIPVGTYLITETSTGSYYAVEGSNQQTVVKPEGKVTEVTFTNYYYGSNPQTGSLTINKTVSGLSRNRAFSFQVSGPNGYSKTVTISASEFYQGKGNYTINGLTPGSYTVTETNYQVDQMVREDTPTSKSTTVTKGANASVSFTNNYSPIPETVDVTVNYLYNGQPIHDPYTTTIDIGSSYDVNNKVLETITKDGIVYKYLNSTGDALSGTNAQNDKVINLHYRLLNQYQVTVKYYTRANDSTGYDYRTGMDEVLYEGAEDSNYTVYESSFNNKTFSDGSYAYTMYTGVLSGKLDGNKIIHAYYDELPQYDVKVQYFKENSTEAIKEMYTELNKYKGTLYDVTEQIPDEIKVGDIEYVRVTAIPANAKSGEDGIQNDVNIIIYYREKAKHNVTVNYYKENTSDALQNAYVSLQMYKGASYDVTGQIPNEIKVGDIEYVRVTAIPANAKSGENGIQENVVIDIYYREKTKFAVTVNYYKEGTTEELADPYVLPEAYTGTDYYVPVAYTTQKQIENYTYVSMDGDSTSGKLDEDKVINVYFKENEKYTVTVYYLLEGTDIELDDPYETLAAYANSDYEIAKRYVENKQIRNYVYVDHEGDPVSGVLDENKEIYVYFREAEEYTITINYYRYGTTQKIAKSVEIGPEEADSEYSISRSLTSGKRIAGYRYHSMSGDATSGILDEDKEINVYFRRVSGGSSEEPDDPPTPPTPPYVPEVIIPDENVPQAPLPVDDTSDNEITIIDEEVPLGNLPNTGDESMVALLLMVMIAALAGIVILVRNKKSA